MTTVIAGERRGFVYRAPAFEFQSDRRGQVMSVDALGELARVSGQPQVYTYVPPGSGVRIGIDRDEDGVFDGDERDTGTDPADTSSHP